MKRLLSILFCFGLFFSLTACGGNKEENEWIEVGKFAKQKALEFYNISDGPVYSAHLELEKPLSFTEGQKNNLKGDIEDGRWLRLQNKHTFNDLLSIDEVYYFYFADSSILEENHTMRVFCKDNEIVGVDYDSYPAKDLDEELESGLTIFYFYDDEGGDITYSFDKATIATSDLLNKIQ